MDRVALRAYLKREWSVAEGRKRAHWAREFAAGGPEATIEAAHALWRHMRLARPDWPSPARRREDFLHHVELKQRIDRAAGGVLGLTDR